MQRADKKVRAAVVAGGDALLVFRPTENDLDRVTLPIRHGPCRPSCALLVETLLTSQPQICAFGADGE